MENNDRVRFITFLLLACLLWLGLTTIAQNSRANQGKNDQSNDPYQAAASLFGAQADKVGMASWYSNEEYPPGSLMANGEEFNDEHFTCASWDYPFGTVLGIYYGGTTRIVYVRVTDRGPAKRLYEKGRIIDLSKKAFETLAPLDYGVIPVAIYPQWGLGPQPGIEQ